MGARRPVVRGALAIVALLLAPGVTTARAQDRAFGQLEPMRIAGYAGEAMQPFIARDGRFSIWRVTR